MSCPSRALPDCALLQALHGPNCAAIECKFTPPASREQKQDFATMTSRAETAEKILPRIAEFNKKGVEVTDATSFAGDLEWDSLTVMDFVAAIEDDFDIIITMNMQAEIETVGQLVDAVAKLNGE
jgi:acyl carrier protein